MATNNIYISLLYLNLILLFNIIKKLLIVINKTIFNKFKNHVSDSYHLIINKKRDDLRNEDRSSGIGVPHGLQSKVMTKTIQEAFKKSNLKKS